MSRRHQRVLVTGAAGFIGSHVAAILSGIEGQYGSTVIGLEQWEHKREQWKNVRKVPIEWVDEYVLLEDLDLDAVVHCAWLADTRAPMSAFERDLELLRKLVTFCAAHNKHLVFTSSAAIYGLRESRKGPTRRVLGALEPMSPYAWSKWQAEALIESYRRRGLSATVWRPFNVYGPNEYHKGPMASLALQLHNAMLTGSKIELFRSTVPSMKHGEQKRDWIYVADAAGAIAWSAYEHVDATYDLGTGTARTFLEFAKICADLGDYQGKIGFKDMPKDMIHQYQSFTEADIEPLFEESLFPFKFRPIEEGLMTYYERYLLPGRLFA